MAMEQIGFIKEEPTNKNKTEQLEQIKNLENKTKETQEIISKFFEKSLDSLNSEDLKDFENFLNFIQKNFQSDNDKLLGIIELYKEQKEKNSSIEKQIERLSPEDRDIIKSIRASKELSESEKREKIEEVLTRIEAIRLIL